MMMRVNLCSGGQHAPGWWTVDKDAPDVDYQIDVTQGLPFRDSEVDLLLCHHALDLMGCMEVNGVLAECHRVLVPGGWMRVSLFDPLKAMGAYDDNDVDWFADRGAPDAPLRDQLDFMLHQNGARRWITTPLLLASVLEGAGFMAYRESCMRSSGPPDLVAFDSRAAESMFVDAQKGIA